MRQDRQTTDPVGQDVVQHHHQRRVPVRVRDVGDEQRAPQRLRSGQRPGKGVRGERQCGVPVAGTGAPHLGEVGIDVEVGVVEPVGTPESEGRLDQALAAGVEPGRGVRRARSSVSWGSSGSHRRRRSQHRHSWVPVPRPRRVRSGLRDRCGRCRSRPPPFEDDRRTLSVYCLRPSRGAV